MNPASVIVIVVVMATLIPVGILTIRAIHGQNRQTAERRQEMLNSLKASIEAKKENEQYKAKATEYKKRLVMIADRHFDSNDGPGYCAADDLPYPCPTADLANLRKKPDLVK